MSEFCKNERHGGICVKTGTYCNLSACPYEQLEQFASVVRCKDCIHYDLGVCLKIYSDGNVQKDSWQSRNPNDFCSYGERKEGGADND